MSIKLTAGVLVIAGAFLAGCGDKAPAPAAAHESHEGHDHGDHEGHDHAEHEGHDQDDHEGHDQDEYKLPEVEDAAPKN